MALQWKLTQSLFAAVILLGAFNTDLRHVVATDPVGEDPDDPAIWVHPPNPERSLVCTDQLEGNSEYCVYRREGKSGSPHDHSEVVAVIRGGADSTDGIEVTAAALGTRFPQGLLVAMNSGGRNFLLYPFPKF
jgi:myo-inositol-hexaphosphate 3-phosphohydrolase